MASAGQILIKIGHHYNDWKIKSEREVLSYDNFVQIMSEEGYPSYSSMKSINEKWKMLRTWGIVEKVVRNDEHNYYLINIDRIRHIIQESIPLKARVNYALKDTYLKTGRID